MKLKDIIAVALLSALICLLAPWTVPIGAIPLTLATFAVYLAGALGGAKRGALAVCVYILIGACGLPVFAGFMGGAQVLLSPTGGFLLGYIPCACLSGIFIERTERKQYKWALPAGMLLGTVALYALGVTAFMLQTKCTPAAAFAACVAPFLAGDAVKLALAAVIAYTVRPRLKFLGK